MTESEAQEAGEALALIEWPHGEKTWNHLRFESADYEGPMWDGEDVVTRGHDDRWVSPDTGEGPHDWDVKVIAWAPLPEVVAA